ncbi:MAG: hypothetical protein OWS74_01510, partial [Firmicutes bacterium]|nr:hypothetical protein [Bacillota bacterium]
MAYGRSPWRMGAAALALVAGGFFTGTVAHSAFPQYFPFGSNSSGVPTSTSPTSTPIPIVHPSQQSFGPNPFHPASTSPTGVSSHYITQSVHSTPVQASLNWSGYVD